MNVQAVKLRADGFHGRENLLLVGSAMLDVSTGEVGEAIGLMPSLKLKSHHQLFFYARPGHTQKLAVGASDPQGREISAGALEFPKSELASIAVFGARTVSSANAVGTAVISIKVNVGALRHDAIVMLRAL